MKYYYDPYGRLRTVPNPRQTSAPNSSANTNSNAGSNAGRVTLENYQQLTQAYQQLQAKTEQAARELENQTKTLAQVRQELEIKDEALRRQNADIKQMEAELVWSRAALRQQDKTEEGNAAEELSWRERYLKLQGELDALRRRWEQRFTTETANARHEILRDMLPLADHLELALQHSSTYQGEQARDYVRNLEVTQQAFLATLKRYNVTPIAALGQPFDPNLHEAVGQMQDTSVPSVSSIPSGHVAQVVQTGYVEGGKLLRPARVLVRE